MRLLVALTVVGAVAGAALGLYRRNSGEHHVTPTYFSATTGLGYDPSAGGQTVSDGASDLDTVAVFITSQRVADEVGRQLGEDGAALARTVTTVVRPTLSSIDVTAVAATKARAEQVAATFASVATDAYTAEVATRSADQATQLSKRLDDLKARREQVAQDLLDPTLSVVDRDTLEAQSDALVNQYRIAYDRFINLASPEVSASPLFTLARPQAIPIDATAYATALERGRTGANHIDADTAATLPSPNSPTGSFPDSPIALAIVGAFLGFAVAMGIVMLRARFDPKLRTRPDFEEAFGLPILGGVPVLNRQELARYCLAVIEKPYSPSAEVFRAVRAALLLRGTDDADRQGALVVMVSSAQPKEGKSTDCANLAAAFAESGRSVLAINCDYRRPTLHRYFGMADQPGQILPTAVQGLSLVSNVTQDQSVPGRIAAQQRAFVEAQRDRYDVILLDTAPLLSTADPIDIVSVADFVLLVGRPNLTEREHTRQTTELLERHRVVVAGLLDDRGRAGRSRLLLLLRRLLVVRRAGAFGDDRVATRRAPRWIAATRAPAGNARGRRPDRRSPDRRPCVRSRRRGGP